MFSVNNFQKLQQLFVRFGYLQQQKMNSQFTPKIKATDTRWMSSNKHLKMDANHRPNSVDKYLLVWMKKYPSISEIPAMVSPGVMERVRNQARVKISIIMCVVTALGMVAMAISGKNAAKRGESLKKMNEDWHQQQSVKSV